MELDLIIALSRPLNVLSSATDLLTAISSRYKRRT